MDPLTILSRPELWVGLGVLVVVFRLLKKARVQMRLKKAKDFVKARRQKRWETVHKLLEQHKDVVSELLQGGLHEKSCVELADMIKSGRVSAFHSLLVFLKRILDAQRDFNCLADEMMLEAIDQARQIDQKIAAGERDLGVFCGVPFSVKDSLHVAGCDSTNGLARFIQQPATTTSPLATLLTQAGGIAVVKSNVPQTLLSFECANPVYGRSTNPHNPAFTSGGSSGGEGVLLATAGTLMGIGTDVGGSIRIPAHFCGVCGLKPTSRRLSFLESRKSIAGQEAVAAAPGPMARNVQDLVEMMRVWLAPERPLSQLDVSVIPLPFDEKEYQSQAPLRIGYYVYDGFLEASPACVRAVNMVVESLQKAGYTLVPFKLPRGLDAALNYFGLMSADGVETVLSLLQGEVIERMFGTLLKSARTPNFVKATLATLLQYGAGQSRLAQFLRAIGKKSVTQYYKLVGQRADYRQQVFNQWRQDQIDVLICPPHALPAIPHDTFGELSHSASYCMLFNLLDFPAGVLPVTTVQPADAFPSKPSDMLEARARSFYDPVKSAGLPVGVQVVGLPFQEEKVLRAMKIVESVCPFQRK